MRVQLSNLLLVTFNLQQSLNRSTGSSSLSSISASTSSLLEKIPFLSSNPFNNNNDNNRQQGNERRNLLVQELLMEASKVGQVGSLASDEERNKLQTMVDKIIPLSDPSPAKFPLIGQHRLVYSAAPGASSGRVIGSLVGKVTQLFETEEIFYNRVAFGPLMIALQAKREIKNSSTIKVSFLETSFSLFGKVFSKKTAGGGGIWKCRFVGKIKDVDGSEKIIRIMETPSLFILEQKL